jgi:hypothetical protein
LLDRHKEWLWIKTVEDLLNLVSHTYPQVPAIMGLSVFPPIGSKQIPQCGPLGDAGASGGGGGGGGAVVLIALLGECRGLFAGLGATGGRLLEMISISGDPVRSITSVFRLLAAGRCGIGIGLDREPLAKLFPARSSSSSSWLSIITISSSSWLASLEEFISSGVLV